MPRANNDVAEIFDYLLHHDLTEACGIGQSANDRTCPFNNLSKAELRMMLQENNIAYPDYNEDRARITARFLIEREYYRRAGNTERVNKITARMEESMRFQGVKYMGDSAAMEAIAEKQAQAGEVEPPTTQKEPMTTKKSTKTKPVKVAKTPEAKPAPKTASKAPSKPGHRKATRHAAPPASKKVGKDTPKRSTGRPRVKAAKRPRRVAAGDRKRAPKLFTGKIKFLAKENPFRAGSKLAETFDLMRKSGTVEEFRKAAQRYPQKYTLQYLWLIRDKGHIKIEN